jgi:hypothetical protein
MEWRAARCLCPRTGPSPAGRRRRDVSILCIGDALQVICSLPEAVRSPSLRISPPVPFVSSQTDAWLYPFEPMALEKEYRRVVPVSSGPVIVAVAISGYEGVSRSRTWSTLMCGSGSGIRDPLKTNSRGKLVVFSVVAILFLQNDCGRVIE